MARLLLTPIFCALLAALPAAAQVQLPKHHIIQNIAGIYEYLNAEASHVTVNGAPVSPSTRFISPEDEVIADYSNLRQIALVRHGEPELTKTGKFSYEEASQFLVNYDSVGIVVPDEPFFNVGDTAEVAIFSSPLNRARTTAEYLFGTENEMVYSPDFREFETTIGKFSPRLRLPIKLWTAFARVKWMLGVDRNGIESFADARERARKTARQLAEASEEKPKVVLVAHGFLNRYVKQNLEDMGWKVVRDGGSGYLATTILVKIDDEVKEKNQLMLNAN
ncbi:histidine phosphatase family protein [Pontibacter pamirensis]|uniref:histidine phosphatase family protein n=1 Tax=Pontibacter pamirensis TaxID=2562824 RepID=UPI0013896684|nr:histidine phosphatase family protein [Pontibacter pamirensis]